MHPGRKLIPACLLQEGPAHCRRRSMPLSVGHSADKISADKMSALSCYVCRTTMRLLQSQKVSMQHYCCAERVYGDLQLQGPSCPA